jgi:1,4-alpha-glucan branching enzyme
MIRQEPVPTAHGRATRVTFELPKSFWAESIHLVGDFNGWCTESHPFRRNHDGSWSISVDLRNSGPSRFLYLVDGDCWLTDGQAEDGGSTGTQHTFMVRPMAPETARPRLNRATPARRGQPERLPTMPKAPVVHG